MSNHLGNVLTVINDIKVPYLDGSDVAYYATIVSTADYSPFGVQLDGRTVSAESYRYGFNGMEKDDELKGSGNSYTTEFRMLDSRLGRWLSLDPLARKFPWQSPYVAFDNNPIFYRDPRGLAAESEPKSHTVKKGETLSGIAKQYGVSEQAIIDANSCGPDGTPGAWDQRDRDKKWVYAGETLVIPNHNVKSEFMKGDVISVEQGQIQITEFHSTQCQDLGISQMAIDFNFSLNDGTELTYENSQYRWIQTVSTNEHINDMGRYNAGGAGSNVICYLMDIGDRHCPTSHITYSSQGMTLGGNLLRYSREHVVFFHAETSLIKVNNNGTVEILYTLTWGFNLYPDGSSQSIGLNSTMNPSEFHIRMMDSNINNCGTNNSTPYEIPNQ